MRQLQSQIETVPRKGISYEPINLDDLIHPLCRWAWDDIEARNKLHKYAKHVRSSQSFAVNLFGGLPESGICAIMGSFFGPIGTVERPVLEWATGIEPGSQVTYGALLLLILLGQFKGV
jgi:hypothetical protein